MGIIIGLLPFIVFALLNGTLGATAALLAGAATSAALVVRTRQKGQELRILEAGTLLLFLALSAVTAIVAPHMDVLAVRLVVDLGLLAIILVSMVLRRPFTLAYAREQVPREHWDSPEFLRRNMVITGGWAVAILAMVVAEAAVLFIPGVPRHVATVVIVGALVGAIAFTKRQADR